MIMASYEQLEEDDAFLFYDISSSSSSPLHPMLEFEFQISHTKLAKVPLTSPADELFYHGKLLPLHLPSRLQMVQNLLQTSQVLPNNTTSSATTPFESLSVSMPASCYVSGELNPKDEYCESSSVIIQPPNPCKSWLRKLKSMKQSLKLIASNNYLKSLFAKTTNGSCVSSKAKESSFVNGFIKVGRRNSITESGGGGSHRRSFSGAIKWHSSSSASSSSSGSSSDFSSFSGPQLMLKRSSSVNSEGENSIYGAIAYCKRSQKGLSSLSAAKIAVATTFDCAENN